MQNKDFDDKIIEAILIPVIIIFMIVLWLLIEISRPPQYTKIETTTETQVVENFVESVENIEIETIEETTTESQYVEKEMILTAYCPCEKCCGVYALDRPKDNKGKYIVYTASGNIARSGKTIAVDPKYIPYGTEIVIDGQTYIAEDCGGKIKGNRIDVYFDTHQKALDFVYPHGKIVKNVKVML